MSSSYIDPATVITPLQFDVLQKVFDDIARETWFDDTDENRVRLAAIVMNTFRAGKTKEFDLLVSCHEVARDQFRR